MKKNEEYLETTGTVVAILGNSNFTVKCANGEIITAKITAEFRSKKKRGVSSRITEGNTVKVKISINDLKKGNIVGFF